MSELRKVYAVLKAFQEEGIFPETFHPYIGYEENSIHTYRQIFYLLDKKPIYSDKDENIETIYKLKVEKNTHYDNLDALVAKVSISPLVNYCGGFNYGAINVDKTKHRRKGYGTAIVLFQILYNMSIKRAYSIATNNHNSDQLALMRKVAKLLKNVPDIDVKQETITNLNTNNKIVVTTINAHDYGKIFNNNIIADYTTYYNSVTTECRKFLQQVYNKNNNHATTNSADKSAGQPKSAKASDLCTS